MYSYMYFYRFPQLLCTLSGVSSGFDCAAFLSHLQVCVILTGYYGCSTTVTLYSSGLRLAQS